MQTIREGAIRASRPAHRSVAFVVAVVVGALLLATLVVWRVTDTEQRQEGDLTRDVVTTIERDGPIVGAHRPGRLPKRGEVEFPAVGPHPPGKQPKSG